MILVIDNFDSFVFNLARYCECLGHAVQVTRNNQITLKEIRKLAPDAILLSPGPCTPNEAGLSLEIVEEFAGHIPILGICLGHQTIAQAFGGTVDRSPEPMHGRVSLIEHANLSVFAGLPNPMKVCRYHSLVATPDTLPNELEVLAKTPQNIVMAIQHREYPVVGLQFHPESILTDYGFELLQQFFDLYCIQPQTSPRPISELKSQELACEPPAHSTDESSATQHSYSSPRSSTWQTPSHTCEQRVSTPDACRVPLPMRKSGAP